MKYLKRFNESLGFELNTKEGYEIVFNHKYGEKIMNILEENFGTKENPLNKYKDPKDDDDHDPVSYTYYGSKNEYRGDMIFLLISGRMGKDTILVGEKMWDILRWERSEYYTIFSTGGVKYLLGYDEIVPVLEWYLYDVYKIQNTNIEMDNSTLDGVSGIYPKDFYLKEGLGFELEQPKGMKIVMDHTRGKEILEFLEIEFGTKDEPLNKYYDANDGDDHSFSYYGTERGISFSYSIRPNVIDTIWINYDTFKDLLETVSTYVPTLYSNGSKFKEKEQTKDILRWYIHMIYGINMSEKKVEIDQDISMSSAWEELNLWEV